MKYSLTIKTIPPLLLVVLIGIIMWLSQLWLTIGKIDIPDALGRSLVIVILGIIPIMLALLQFIYTRTTVNPLEPEKSKQLVTTGIFRITRNPMYLGFLLCLIGWGIFLENTVSLAWTCFFYWHINKHQIPFEEKALQAHFQQAFTDYCQRVRRWL